ncbi:unnamed protein product, partial [Laminaria digitata]
REDEHPHRPEGCNWMPEYGSWMVEGTPKRPFQGLTTNLAEVEWNMRLRRNRLVRKYLKYGLFCCHGLMSNFPLFGVNDFTDPPSTPEGPIAQSEYVSDAVITPLPRLAAATANIRDRRGKKVIS